MSPRLTKEVKRGLGLIDAEMTATSDTMDDRPKEQEAIRSALVWIRSKSSKRTQAKCKYGDPLCPCQDGDPCHYEGKDAWPQPGPAA